MFSSPMSHFFKHVLLSYRESGANLRRKLDLVRELNRLEWKCIRLQTENPGNPKLPALIKSVRRMKAEL